MKKIFYWVLLSLCIFFGSVTSSYGIYTRMPNQQVYTGQNVFFTASTINTACKFIQTAPITETIIDIPTGCQSYFPYTWIARIGTFKFSYVNGGVWVDDTFTVKQNTIQTVEVQELSSDTELFLQQYSYMNFWFLAIIACLLLFQIFVKFFTRK